MKIKQSNQPKKEDIKKLKSFIEKIEIPRKFWVINFIGYLVGFFLKTFGMVLVLPLVKGLIEKDYSFIFDNFVMRFVISNFPFVEELSDSNIFILFSIAIIFFIGISMFLDYLISMYTWNEKQKFILSTNSLILDHYLKPENTSLFQIKSSELRSRLVALGNHMGNYVTSFGSLINHSFNFLASFVILVLISRPFSLIALIFILFYFSIFYFSKKYIRESHLKVNISNIQYNSIFQDILGRYKLIQIFNKHNKEKENFLHFYKDMISVKKTKEKIEKILSPVTTFFEMVALFGMGFIIGKTLLLDTSLGFTSGLVFIVLFQKTLISTNNFINALFIKNITADVMSSMLDNVLYEDFAKEDGTKIFKGVNDCIDIRNLKFGYDNNLIFNNFNAKIKAKKINFIIGPNGSGKSSLISLIMRLRDTPKNSIYIDDVDLLDYDLNTLRSNVSFVAQDINLFHGTLRENISYGNEYSEEDIMSALDKVGLRSLVDSFPNGLDTIVENDGLNFSGGQKQRFGIAQSILNDSDIIIFDEATKSIDAESEDIIMKMLVNDFTDKTRIVISHNIDHIKYADNVIKLS